MLLANHVIDTQLQHSFLDLNGTLTWLGLARYCSPATSSTRNFCFLS